VVVIGLVTLILYDQQAVDVHITTSTSTSKRH
jgi:hypothetical protein